MSVSLHFAKWISVHEPFFVVGAFFGREIFCSEYTSEACISYDFTKNLFGKIFSKNSTIQITFLMCAATCWKIKAPKRKFKCKKFIKFKMTFTKLNDTYEINVEYVLSVFSFSWRMCSSELTPFYEKFQNSLRRSKKIKNKTHRKPWNISTCFINW